MAKTKKSKKVEKDAAYLHELIDALRGEVNGSDISEFRKGKVNTKLNQLKTMLK